MVNPSNLVVQRIDMMLEDLDAASDIYRPTAYWCPHITPILNEVRQNGIESFRRSSEPSIRAFGAGGYQHVGAE